MKSVLFRLVVLSLFLALAACAGAQSGQSGPVTVKITADDFSFKSSLTTFKVGVPYHFEVTNQGTVAHEIMLIQPIEPGKMDMEEMDKMALAHIEEADLPPGATKSFDFTFTQPYPAGQLEFACHLTGHYEQGMHLPIIVEQ
jgi:uncharacterized cupredoxin-like copper-binding protein